MGDSDIMTNLATAIMTKFNATTGGSHNAHYTAVNGRLFKGRAPTGAEYPYSAFMVVMAQPERTFSEDYRSIIVQFFHYSDDTLSAAECESINAACNDLFDECSLAITGARLEWMRIQDSPGAQPEQMPTANGMTDGWLAITEYEARVSMN